MDNPRANERGMLDKAEVAYASGRIRDAEALARLAMKAIPGESGAIVFLSKLLRECGRVPEQLQLLQSAVGHTHSVPVMNELATTLFALRRIDEALALCDQIRQIDPSDVGAYNIGGQCFLAKRDPVQAEMSFRRGLEMHPELANLHFNLGLALQAQGRIEESLAPFQRAAQLDPDSVVPNAKLGQTLLHLGQSKSALPHLRKAVELDPKSKPALLNLGEVLLDSGDTEEAEKCARRVLELDPRDSYPHSLLGRIRQQEGKFSDAVECFRRAIQLDPQKAPAYFGIAYSQRMKEDDQPLIRQMEGLLKQPPPKFSVKSQSLLCYALGKTNDDLANYETAIRFFDEANRIELAERNRKGLSFDRERYRSTFDLIIDTFEPGYFERMASLGNASQTPVFVVGMLRSGTTLLEQVLSSHPEVGGAGELPFWRDNGNALVVEASQKRLDLAKARQVAAEYLRTLQASDANAQRIVDKMPLNFIALGLIHLLFPKARIIHCRRKPVDNCLSIYVTPYRSGPEFGHDRGDIVFAYRQYERLMAHWRTVLPSTSLLEVDYEDLVANRESVSRRMIEFLELEWDDRCLAPEENAKNVATPSQWQVRQPIYKSSIDRAKHYEPWLGEFQSLV